MSDPFFRIEIGPNRFMCISPLDEDMLEAAAVDGLGDEFGFFVYETTGPRRDAIEVLAKCPTYETAVRLLELIRPAVAAERARA